MYLFSFKKGLPVRHERMKAPFRLLFGFLVTFAVIMCGGNAQATEGPGAEDAPPNITATYRYSPSMGVRQIVEWAQIVPSGECTPGGGCLGPATQVSTINRAFSFGKVKTRRRDHVVWDGASGMTLWSATVVIRRPDSTRQTVELTLDQMTSGHYSVASKRGQWIAKVVIKMTNPKYPAS